MAPSSRLSNVKRLSDALPFKKKASNAAETAAAAGAAAEATENFGASASGASNSSASTKRLSMSDRLKGMIEKRRSVQAVEETSKEPVTNASGSQQSDSSSAPRRKSLTDRFRPSLRETGSRRSVTASSGPPYSVGSIYENLFKASVRSTAELLSPVKTSLDPGVQVVLMDIQTVMRTNGTPAFRGLVVEPKSDRWGWINLQTEKGEPLLSTAAHVNSLVISSRYLLTANTGLWSEESLVSILLDLRADDEVTMVETVVTTLKLEEQDPVPHLRCKVSTNDGTVGWISALTNDEGVFNFILKQVAVTPAEPPSESPLKKRLSGSFEGVTAKIEEKRSSLKETAASKSTELKSALKEKKHSLEESAATKSTELKAAMTESFKRKSVSTTENQSLSASSWSIGGKYCVTETVPLHQDEEVGSSVLSTLRPGIVVIIHTLRSTVRDDVTLVRAQVTVEPAGTLGWVSCINSRGKASIGTHNLQKTEEQVTSAVQETADDAEQKLDNGDEEDENDEEEEEEEGIDEPAVHESADQPVGKEVDKDTPSVINAASNAEAVLQAKLGIVVPNAQHADGDQRDRLSERLHAHAKALAAEEDRRTARRFIDAIYKRLQGGSENENNTLSPDKVGAVDHEEERRKMEAAAKEKHEQQLAALRIQAAKRGVDGRKEAKARKETKRLAAEEALKEWEQKEGAAIKIQTVHRGKKSRKEVEAKKEEMRRKMAAQDDTFLKGGLVREEQRNLQELDKQEREADQQNADKNIVEENAALRIQSLHRGKVARLRAKSLREQEIPALSNSTQSGGQQQQQPDLQSPQPQPKFEVDETSVSPSAARQMFGGSKAVKQQNQEVQQVSQPAPKIAEEQPKPATEAHPVPPLALEKVQQLEVQQKQPASEQQLPDNQKQQELPEAKQEQQGEQLSPEPSSLQQEQEQQQQQEQKSEESCESLSKSAMVPWFLKDRMRDEVREIFRNFLEDVEALSVSSHDISDNSKHGRMELAMMLVDRLGQCYDLLSNELHPPSSQAALWDSFFKVDASLGGAMDTEGLALPAVLRPLATRAGTEVPQWVAGIRQSVAPIQTVTFVDLLDWWVEHEATADGSTGIHPKPSVSTAGVLEKHAQNRTIDELCMGLRVYEQTVVVTCSRICERLLVGTWTGSSSGMVLDVLLKILDLIHASLSPIDRALWQFFGNASQSFDGMLTAEETLNGIAEIVRMASDEERPSDDKQESELIELRATVLRQAIEDVFAMAVSNPEDNKVSLADLLAWWEGIDDEFRTATGLNIDVKSVDEVAKAKPSDMFASPISKLGGGLAVDEVLCGHARLLAELTVRKLRRGLGQGTSEFDADSDTHSLPDGPTDGNDTEKISMAPAQG